MTVRDFATDMLIGPQMRQSGNISAFVGPDWSSTLKLFSRFFTDMDVMAISNAAEIKEFSNRSEHPNILRMNPSVFETAAMYYELMGLNKELYESIREFHVLADGEQLWSSETAEEIKRLHAQSSAGKVEADMNVSLIIELFSSDNHSKVIDRLASRMKADELTGGLCRQTPALVLLGDPLDLKPFVEAISKWRQDAVFLTSYANLVLFAGTELSNVPRRISTFRFMPDTATQGEPW